MNKAILIIDDDEAIRKSFQLAFKDTEHTVDVAESGEVGLEKIKNKRYDLIFLDLRMPGINGVEVLKIITKCCTKDIPIYIITAFAQEYFTELRDLRNQGINFEILNKPVSSEEIIAIAQSVL